MISPTIWREVRRRLKDPLVHASFWPGLVAVVVWMLVANNIIRSWLWLPVISSAVAGSLLAVTGTRWIFMDKWKIGSGLCGSCGYNLCHIERRSEPCPECGASGVARAQISKLVRVAAQVPGILLLMASLFFLWVTYLMAFLISQGTFSR